MYLKQPIFIPTIKILGLFLVSIAILSSCASERKFFDITSISEKEKQLLDEGVKHNDMGEYTKAMKKYDEVLEINPDNIMAMAEISFSYFELRQYDMCLEYNLRALEYKSIMESDLLASAANCYDILGQPRKAVDVYEKGKRLNPRNPNILFNLAITYAKLRLLDSAEVNFIETIKIDQTFASAHFGLSNIYMEMNEPVKALFPTMRFLALEAVSPRADMSRRSLAKIMNFDIRKDDSASISIATKSKHYLEEELLLQKLKLDRLNSHRNKRTTIQNFIYELNYLLNSDELKAQSENCQDFVCKHYLPYFMEIIENGLVPALVYTSFRGDRTPEIQQWLQRNEDKLMDMKLFNDVWAWE
jgi:tetratricopeptide (TPR) repeat protein